MKTKEIKPLDHLDAVVSLPGSKSYTHRALIAAALAAGESVLTNALKAEDTEITAGALAAMGAEIDWQGTTVKVTGTGGRLLAVAEPLDLGNSGTSMRFLTAVATLGPGTYRLTGTPRLCRRPMGELLAALRTLGARVAAAEKNDCPPIVVTGGLLRGGKACLSGQTSSQYLSALLLVGPLTAQGVEIEITGDLVSRPYVDITLEVLKEFGISHYREEYQRFFVPGGQRYRSRLYDIEADASSASYFWAAAALTGGRMTVTNLNLESCQGDIDFLAVLARLGCRLTSAPEGLTVEGAPLKGIEMDMSTMPDLVPTLAVLAAFAEGETVINGVAHLRHKESNRLAAIVTELGKMGITAEEIEDGLRIVGGEPHGAVIETYDDHRIAMSFAVAGLKAPSTVIVNPDCVSKSFPEFWEQFENLYKEW
uniref:3-phosphoshikimate 1-carboxyvinyltransferase n=1 Tax=Desulfobacca acetoxidans TaxID=60893 RepID=A0A7V4LCP1_9BACT